MVCCLKIDKKLLLLEKTNTLLASLVSMGIYLIEELAMPDAVNAYELKMLVILLIIKMTK